MLRRLSDFDAASILLWTLAIGVLLFLYLPAAIVILYSFSKEATLIYPLRGLSLEWYGVLIHDGDMLQSLRNSVVVALSSISIGLLVGIPAAFALDRHSFPGKWFLERLLLLPFVLPGVITGIVLLSFFLFLHVRLSMYTVIAGHATLMIAVVITEMSVGLKRWDRTIEQAAMDLGANEVKTFFFVTLPNLQPVIAGAILLGMTLSLDEISRTFFLTGIDNTLPIQIWATMRRGINPEINAVATVVFLFSAFSVVLWTRVMRGR